MNYREFVQVSVDERIAVLTKAYLASEKKIARAMLSYPQARRGYMIYGHIHNNTGDDYWPLIMRRPRMLNAGVDVNNFEPVAFDELLANNNAFQRRHDDTAMANPFDLYCAEA